MNNICLTGRLTSDVELKQTQSGVSVCSFSVAVKRPNVKDTTDFINCVAWRNSAEFISNYFRKGNMIAIAGILTSRKFQDQHGKNHVAFEVVVDRAEFCESRQDGGSDARQEKPAPKETEFEEIGNDEPLPF